MCDTFVSLPGATADGSVILGKNSDREPNEAHEVVVVPGGPREGLVKATHIAIPAAPTAYTTLLAKPYWIWGAEMGVNEHGVAIGNEAVFTTVPRERYPGLLGMDLLRLGLEQAASADEAVSVITTLLRRYGQTGQAGHMHRLEYDNSFLIADPGQAWVLETAGRDWVAKRVERTRSISNALTVVDAWDRSSGVKGGDFAGRHSDFLYTTFSDASSRQCRTTDALTAADGGTTLASAMALLRDHGPKGDLPGWSPARGLRGQTVCAHAGPGPIRISQTTGSMVAHLRPERTTVWVTATSAPCTSVFKPVWLDAGLPELVPPGRWYDPASLWWRHEDLHRATLTDYPERLASYAAHRDALEEEIRHAAEGAESGGQRRAVTERAFGDAEVAERLWSDRIDRMPAAGPSRLFARAWRGFDRDCGRRPA